MRPLEDEGSTVSRFKSAIFALLVILEKTWWIEPKVDMEDRKKKEMSDLGAVRYISSGHLS